MNDGNDTLLTKEGEGHEVGLLQVWLGDDLLLGRGLEWLLLN